MLTALGGVASRLREKLGESLASIQKFDVPLPRATTPSLEALHAYSLALDEGRINPRLEAIPHLKRAHRARSGFRDGAGAALRRLRQHQPDRAGARAVAAGVRAARPRQRARAVLHLVALLPRRDAGVGQGARAGAVVDGRPIRARRSRSTASARRTSISASTIGRSSRSGRPCGSTRSSCRRSPTSRARSWRSTATVKRARPSRKAWPGRSASAAGIASPTCSRSSPTTRRRCRSI